MNLDLETYREKVRGCWMGKSIGGTLGAPYECKRGVFDVSFYTQDLSGGAPPNDDLDIQLVWLNAAERYGRALTSGILAEYWTSWIVPNWAEYGAGKNNLRMGIAPPLSGQVNNLYRDSNGAFIRSEIWACLAPGHPEIAALMAFEDATVDHAREGLHAEIFCAALESAAFAEPDPRRLLDIALSYIPKGCGVARGVAAAVSAYDAGVTWQEARRRVLTEVPGSFGALATPRADMPRDIPLGPTGWDAPGNVGITVLGWLYGKGDFGRSLCTAVNCGEDTDCTAATLGALLGILGGYRAIPRKWIEPVGDGITTLCVNKADGGLSIPRSVSELTDRVVRLAPFFLGPALCDCVTPAHGYQISMNGGDSLFNAPVPLNAWAERKFEDRIAESPFVLRQQSPLFTVWLNYHDEPFIRDGVARTFTVTLENALAMQQWCTLRWHLPAGWEVTPARQITVPLEQFNSSVGRATTTFTLTPRGLDQPRYDLVLDIASNGRSTRVLVPVTLLSGHATTEVPARAVE